MVEERVRDWLREEPDVPPATLAMTTADRVRRTRQRPRWIAHLRRGWSGGPARRPLQLGGAVASVTVALVALGIVWQAATGPAAPSPQPTASPTPSASVAIPPAASPAVSPVASAPPFDGRSVAALLLDQPATSLGTGFGSLWVGDAAGRLIRIDPAGPTVIASIDVGGVPCGPIVAAASSMWLATCGAGVTTADAITIRVDPSTNTVANRYDDAGGDGAGATAMNGLVWFVSNVQDGTLTAVDAVTGEVVRELRIGTPIHRVTAGFGSLWVSPIGRPAVLRLDPLRGTQQAEIALSGDPAFLVTASDAIWLSEPHQWLVGRIDPVVDRVAAEIGASPGVDQLVISETGVVWSLADAEAMAVDPRTNQTIDRFVVPMHRAFDDIGTPVLATLGGVVWFADGTSLLRINPR